MNFRKMAVFALTTFVGFGAAISPAAAQGGSQEPVFPAWTRFLWNYVNPSAMYLTSSSGQSAFGDLMFYRRGNLARKAMRLGPAYGFATLEIINITNKFLPYASHTNEVDLYGPAFRVASSIDDKVIPFAMVGTYYGHLKTSKWDVSDSGFVPSFGLGVAVNVTKGVTFETQYRWNGDLANINFSGVTFDLRLN